MKRTTLVLLLAAASSLLAFLLWQGRGSDGPAPRRHTPQPQSTPPELEGHKPTAPAEGSPPRGDTAAPHAESATGTVVVRVEDEAATPLADVAVNLSWDEGEVKKEVRTDAAGHARFVDVPVGQAHAWAGAQGFQRGGRSLHVKHGEEATRTIVLRRFLAVSGVVLFPSGEPAPRAQVVVREGGSLGGRTVLVGSHDSEVATTEAAEDGTFRLDLPPGKLVTLTATHGRHAPAERALEPRATVEGIVLRLAPGGVLRGTVLAPDGTPAVGAIVRVVPAGIPEMLAHPNSVVGPGGGMVWIPDFTDEMGASTECEGEGEIHRPWRRVTDAEGRFEILGLPLPKRVIALAQGTDGARGAGAEVAVTTDVPETSTVVRLSPRATLAIRTFGPDGKRATGDVALGDKPDEFLAGGGEGCTGLEEDLLFDGLLGGRYRVLLKIEGCLSQTLDVDVPESGTHVLEVHGKRGSTLRVEVVDTAGRQVPSASVSFWTEAHGDVPEQSAEAQTDERGYGELSVPPDATGNLLIRSGRHVERTLKTVRLGPEPLRVVLSSKPIVTFRLVLDGVGLPHPYAWVEERGGRRHRATGAIDAERRLTYWIHQVDEEVLLVLSPFEGARVVLGRVRLKADETRDLGEVRLERGRTVKGRVTDDGGAPVAGVTVRACIPGTPDQEGGFGRGDPTAVSAADGSFTIRGVHRGPAVLRTRHATLAPVAEAEDGGDREVVLRLVPGAFVEGRLHDTAGTPHTKGAVLVEGDTGEHWVTGGLDGSFRLGPLAPGEYRVYRDEQKGEVLTKFSVAAGQSLTVTWRVP